MGKTETVRVGDCVSRLAAVNQFRRWQTVYDHPDNRPLRESRGNPNQLVPGDVVAIPEKQEKVLHLQTGREHLLMVRAQKTRLRIKYAGTHPAQYELRIGTKTMRGSVPADGVIDENISPTEAGGELVVTPIGVAGSTPGRWSLRIGSMQPIDSLVGVQQRLNNLALFAGEEDGRMSEATMEAIKTFKRMQGVPDPTGELDDATRLSILAEHGG
jgi:N-acetylmuramoyl-L-alanine amidase